MDQTDAGSFAAAVPSESFRQISVRPTGSFVEFDAADIQGSVPERFETIVQRYGNEIAVKTRSHQLTYEQLNRAANCVGHALINRLGEPPSQVALLLKNDAPMMTCILGAVKAGKTYVPLDPTHPAVRNRMIWEDSQAKLIVTDAENRELAGALTSSATQVLRVDDLDLERPSKNLSISISPDAAMWILYTSGSTGKPKGVVQTHRNVLHFVKNYTNVLHISSDDRCVLVFSFCVNAGAHEIFSALLNGASLYPLDVKREGVLPLAGWLRHHRITVYCSVPTLFRSFTDTLSGQDALRDLRLIKLVGEPVYRRDVEAYKQHFSDDCLFVNRLGSTETGSICWCFIDKKTEFNGNNVPIGFPAPDNKILLLDDNGQHVDAGEIGEITVKSRFLSPGYWRRPDLTAAAFQFDPQQPLERVYRTGDMGRMLPDGCLVHHGRKDSQVQIRGHRIEVAEIEMALRDLPGVGEAVVVAREDHGGEQRLVAYFAPSNETVPTVSRLRCGLAESLPDYMLPSVFVVIESLPKAPNGKISLSSLPAPGSERPLLDNPLQDPRTAIEECLVDIWSDVLDIAPIGVFDSFFELGGTSLRAMQVISRVENRLGVRLSIQSLFETPTIDKLAVAVVQRAIARETDSSGVQILDDVEQDKRIDDTGAE